MRAYRIVNMLSESLQQHKKDTDLMRWYVLEQYNDDLYNRNGKQTKHQDDVRRGLRRLNKLNLRKGKRS